MLIYYASWNTIALFLSRCITPMLKAFDALYANEMCYKQQKSHIDRPTEQKKSNNKNCQSQSFWSVQWEKSIN